MLTTDYLILMPLPNFTDAGDTHKMRQLIEKRGLALRLGNILKYRGYMAPETVLIPGEAPIKPGYFLVLVDYKHPGAESVFEREKLNALLDNVDKNCISMPSLHEAAT